MDSDQFRFCPELFALRTVVMEKLAASGFEWLSHFKSVDLLHDQYGLEVCGMEDRDDALAIEEILVEMFPTWKVGCLCHKDYGAELGFKAKIFRDGPGFDASQVRDQLQTPEPRDPWKADVQDETQKSPPPKTNSGPDFLL